MKTLSLNRLLLCVLDTLIMGIILLGCVPLAAVWLLLLPPIIFVLRRKTANVTDVKRLALRELHAIALSQIFVIGNYTAGVVTFLGLFRLGCAVYGVDPLWTEIAATVQLVGFFLLFVPILRNLDF